MKKVLGMLETNEKDNVLTAYAKGGAKGLIICNVVLGAFFGTVGLIGKAINRNDEVEVFEKEFKAE